MIYFIFVYYSRYDPCDSTGQWSSTYKE